MEQHRGQRHPTDVTVRFFTRPATIGFGRVINVSATGAFMETQFPLRLLSLVYLQPTDLLPSDAARGVSQRPSFAIARPASALNGVNSEPR